LYSDRMRCQTLTRCQITIYQLLGLERAPLFDPLCRLRLLLLRVLLGLLGFVFFSIPELPKRVSLITISITWNFKSSNLASCVSYFRVSINYSILKNVLVQEIFNNGTDCQTTHMPLNFLPDKITSTTPSHFSRFKILGMQEPPDKT
jgi:hypothetical protein